jgi:formylglycine-generating enzyme required for sulfatase activity
MSDPRLDQIEKIKQSIAMLEATQRTTSVDLSMSILLQRELLAQLEQSEDTATISRVSGGIDAQAESIDIRGDAVGRDKIESRSESTQQTATIIGGGAIAQGNQAKAAGARGIAAESIGGHAITGDDNRIVQAQQYVEKQEVYQAVPPSPVAAAGERYLRRLCLRCNVLPLAALGGEEGSGEEIGLDQVYVALDTQTRVSLTAEEKAKRSDRVLAGREDDRPLSALEAVTQSHRLVLLGQPGSGKSTFVRQLSAWLGAARLGERALLPGWEPDLLPVLVILREWAPLLAKLDLTGVSDDQRDRQLVGTMWDRWRADLQDLKAADFADGLEEALVNGRALLILDGLDEVPEGLRRRVREAVSAVLHAYPKVSRVIVTSRIRSYTGSAVLPGFDKHTLAPFDDDRIRQFVQAWYTAQFNLGRMSKEKADHNTNDLQQAALSKDLNELASNPMLLTTMVIIHQREVGLPRERVRLYSLAVQVLLSRWQTHRGIAVSETLKSVLNDDRRLRSILEHLAYEAHCRQALHKEVANLTRKDILALLEDPAYLGDMALAAEFLDYVDQRAGLLIGFGAEDDGRKPQEYNFPHRTFQEYLAGCYMVSGRGIAREYWKRAEESDYWYVAARLGAEELLYNRRNPETLLDLAYDLCPAAEPSRGAAWRAVVWSGQIASLIGPLEVHRDEKADGGAAYLQRLILRLVQALEGDHLGAIERAEAGRALGRLDDPRPAVMSIDAMQFCFVPRGDFVMGEGKGESGEHVDQRLNYDYWVSRYPITHAQFAAFVAAGGYREPRYWREAEAAGIWKNGQIELRWASETRNRPAQFGDPFDLPNHPVVGITWYEALAFTRWLTEQLRATQHLTDGWEVRLPSEAEWEKAARGGHDVPQSPIVGLPLAAPAFRAIKNPNPTRSFPWGDEIDPNRANYGDTQIGTTSALGAFRQGASPYGVLELSGNVWEWTRSIYREYPYDPSDGREDPESDGRRVLRGGAFGYDEGDVRGACRNYDFPDFRYDLIGFRLVVSPF